MDGSGAAGKFVVVTVSSAPKSASAGAFGPRCTSTASTFVPWTRLPVGKSNGALSAAFVMLVTAVVAAVIVPPGMLNRSTSTPFR